MNIVAETSVSSVFLLPQETDSTTLHAILGALGSGVGLVFFVLLFVYFTRLHHYLNGKGDEIPASLVRYSVRGRLFTCMENGNRKRGPKCFIIPKTTPIRVKTNARKPSRFTVIC